MRIVLGKKDIEYCKEVMRLQNENALFHGCKERMTNAIDHAEGKLIGVCGEYIIHMLLSLRWEPIFSKEQLLNEKLRKPDVGPFEIKTAKESYYQLLVEEKTPMHPMILITRTDHHDFFIRGWIHQRWARLDKYWDPKKRIPAWVVPQRNLNKFDEEFYELIKNEPRVSSNTLAAHTTGEKRA